MLLQIYDIFSVISNFPNREITRAYRFWDSIFNPSTVTYTTITISAACYFGFIVLWPTPPDLVPDQEI